MYDKLVAEVDNTDTSDSVLKTKYNADKKELKKKIPNVTDYVKKAKLTEFKNKIPDVSSLVTKAALTTVENKIPDVSNLVKKTNYNTKVTDIESKLNNHNQDKYIRTPKFNTLAADVFNTRLAQANVVVKTDFDNTVSSLDNEIATNKTKNKSIENEIKKLKTLDLSFFIGKSHFEEDGSQNYLVFQPIKRYIKLKVNNKLYISSWNLKDYMTKLLSLLLDLIIALIH